MGKVKQLARWAALAAFFVREERGRRRRRHAIDVRFRVLPAAATDTYSPEPTGRTRDWGDETV